LGLKLNQIERDIEVLGAGIAEESFPEKATKKIASKQTDFYSLILEEIIRFQKVDSKISNVKFGVVKTLTLPK